MKTVNHTINLGYGTLFISRYKTDEQVDTSFCVPLIAAYDKALADGELSKPEHEIAVSQAKRGHVWIGNTANAPSKARRLRDAELAAILCRIGRETGALPTRAKP